MLTTLVVLGQVCVFLYSSGAGHLLHNLLCVFAIFVGTLALVALVVGLVVIFSDRLLGRIIKACIEKYDKQVLGVDVTFGHLEVALYRGKLCMKELIVKNPPEYSSAYLLKVDEVLVEIDTSILLLSKFKKIELQSLIFRVVDAIWEKNSLQNSNVNHILEHVEAKRAQIQGGPFVPLEQRVADRLQQEFREKAVVAANELCEMAAVAAGVVGRHAYGLGAVAAQRALEISSATPSERSVGTTALNSSAKRTTEQPEEPQAQSSAEQPAEERPNQNSSEETAKEGATGEGPQEPDSAGAAEQPKTIVRIQQLAIEDVGVKLASTLYRGKGVRLAVADIKFEDFTKDKENGWTLDQVVILIVYSFLKTLVVNTLGKTLGDELF